MFTERHTMTNTTTYATPEDYVADNIDTFEKAERARGGKLTDEQRAGIAQLVISGADFYEAFRRVTSLTATLHRISGAHGGAGQTYRVVVENWQGERVETGTDTFSLNLPSALPVFDVVAEMLLSDLPGIWFITRWR